jgi:hypothetical protein
MKIIRRTVTALPLTVGALLVATPAYAAPNISPLPSLPLLGVPLAAALRTLEGVVDTVAYAVLSLIPTQAVFPLIPS